MHSILYNTASCTASGLLAKLKLVQRAEGFARECFILRIVMRCPYIILIHVHDSSWLTRSTCMCTYMMTHTCTCMYMYFDYQWFTTTIYRVRSLAVHVVCCTCTHAIFCLKMMSFRWPEEFLGTVLQVAWHVLPSHNESKCRWLVTYLSVQVLCRGC